MKYTNSVTTLLALLMLLLPCSLSADHCAVNENGEVLGCSLLVNRGEPLQPTIAFSARKHGETREWELGVRVLLKDWVQLNGDSEIKIDDGEFEVLEYRASRKADIKQGLVSESAQFLISEDMVEAIANADDQVLLRISAESSDPIEISVGPKRLSELDDLLAEVREKI